MTIPANPAAGLNPPSLLGKATPDRQALTNQWTWPGVSRKGVQISCERTWPPSLTDRVGGIGTFLAPLNS